MKFIVKFLLPGLLLLLVWSSQSGAQGVLKKVLYLGNSYTYFNNLPGLTAALASSAGDSLYFESNTPGGYTLGWQPIAHAYDPVSLAKIRNGGWDFTVLQEQSQTPAIPALRDSCMYPAALLLNDSVKDADSCAQTMLFLTWGRQTGGIQCFTSNYCSPDFTGFGHMQDSLTAAYKRLSDSLSCPVAPAGEAWRYVIEHHGMVLHDADGSHPNLKGSYLTACVFYHSIFRKPATGLSFTAGLQPDTALLLQQAADTMVAGYSGFWNLWMNEPEASFDYTIQEKLLITANHSQNSTRWHWDFGDVATSQEFEPIHLYANSGNYLVKMIACNPCHCDSTAQEITAGTVGISNDPVENPDISLISHAGGGLFRFTGFCGDGHITLTAINGTAILKSKVYQGSFRENELSPGIYVWVLHDLHHQLIEKGRLVILP